MKLIDKDALVAEIDKRLHQLTDATFDSMIGRKLIEIKDFLNTIEVKEIGVDLGDPKGDKSSTYVIDTETLAAKEVDLKEEIEKCLKRHSMLAVGKKDFTEIAKHFFELGLRVNNPITAADRGTAEEIIINLKRVEKDYRIDLTKEIEWVRNQVKKGEDV